MPPCDTDAVVLNRSRPFFYSRLPHLRRCPLRLWAIALSGGRSWKGHTRCVNHMLALPALLTVVGSYPARQNSEGWSLRLCTCPPFFWDLCSQQFSSWWLFLGCAMYLPPACIYTIQLPQILYRLSIRVLPLPTSPGTPMVLGVRFNRYDVCSSQAKDRKTNLLVAA